MKADLSPLKIVLLSRAFFVALRLFLPVLYFVDFAQPTVSNAAQLMQVQSNPASLKNANYEGAVPVPLSHLEALFQRSVSFGKIPQGSLLVSDTFAQRAFIISPNSEIEVRNRELFELGLLTTIPEITFSKNELQQASDENKDIYIYQKLSNTEPLDLVRLELSPEFKVIANTSEFLVLMAPPTRRLKKNSLLLTSPQLMLRATLRLENIYFNSSCHFLFSN